MSDITHTKANIALLLSAGVKSTDQTANGLQLRRDLTFVRAQEQAERLIAADPPERYTIG